MVNIHSKLIMERYENMKPRISELRESKGLKQKFVAEKLGISQQQLSDWERGKTYPRIDRANDLAKYFNVKVQDLYEWE